MRSAPCAFPDAHFPPTMGERTATKQPRRGVRPVQLRQENSQRQTQSQKIAPHLIQANTLLQCSTAELLQLIEQEQRENPALDEAEDELELEVRGLIARPRLAEETAGIAGSKTTETASTCRRSTMTARTARHPPAGRQRFRPADDGARADDAWANAAVSTCARWRRRPSDIRIAEYLVDWLDERGLPADRRRRGLRRPACPVRADTGRHRAAAGLRPARDRRARPARMPAPATARTAEQRKAKRYDSRRRGAGSATTGRR